LTYHFPFELKNIPVLEIALMKFSRTLRKIADSKRFNFFIVGLIVLTSIFIGLDTYPSIRSRWGHLLELIDRIILGIFVLEQVIRLGAEGRRPWRYFLDPWNLFDFLIISLCLLPIGQSSVAIVRLVRVLRVLRLIRTIPKLRMIIHGVISSLGSIGYIAVLLCVHFYLFAVLGVSFFSAVDSVHFADLQTSLLTLFQVLTLENWPDVMAPSKAMHPVGSPLFFIVFIVLGTMIILNLFVGVIVGGMTDASEEIKRESQELKRMKKLQEGNGSPLEIVLCHVENVEKEIASLKEQVAALVKQQQRLL
jgi:voltage-gated sodium channel